MLQPATGASVRGDFARGAIELRGMPYRLALLNGSYYITESYLTVPGYSAGADYYDFFYPTLEYSQPEDKDPAYWPDGRTRRFSNDALGLCQSECFRKGGLTYVECHVAAHETEIERNPPADPEYTKVQGLLKAIEGR